MKKTMIYGAIICSILIASCTKVEDSSAEVGKINSSKSSDSVVEINTTRSAGNILGSMAGPTTRAVGDDPFTEIREVESFESIVLPELQPHIWIGNIMTKSSIVNCVYKPLIYPRTSIKVSLTLPGASPQEIEKPSYSKYLAYVQEQTAKGTFVQNDEFNFTIEQFSSYNELKIAFGSNANTDGIFWGSSSSSSSSDHLIQKATGLYVKFYQTSFKAIMDYPQEQIATIPENMIDSAVYINSITYGRLGILTLETNESAYSAKDKINKIFKTIFYSSSSTFTNEEQTFLNGCVFKVYLIGGNGSTSVQSFSGLDGFLQHIKKGSFSKDEPGTPIFCTFNHVKDNSPVSMNFKFTIKKDPLYVELVHEPRPIEEAGFNFNKVKGFGYLRVNFYRDRAKVPTIAHPSIAIKLKKNTIDNLYTPNPSGTKRTYSYSEVYEGKNAGNHTSINSYCEHTVPFKPEYPSYDIYHSEFYMYTFDENQGSRGRINYLDSPDREYIYEYYLEESDEYVILNPRILNMVNCPLSRRGF